MKIAFFCNEYPPRPHGGIGTFVHMLAEALVREGHSVTIVQWGAQNSDELRGGVRVVTLPESTTRHIAWLMNRLRLWRWLRSEVASRRIEIIEIPEYQGCLPFPFRACPVVVRLHLAESHIRYIMEGVRGRGYWLEKATLFWHRNWIGVSRYILDETCRFFDLIPRQSTVVHNPVVKTTPENLPTVAGLPKRYVLFVGSISERKGALLLAEAMRDVFARYPDVHLVYVGPETEYLAAPISHTIRSIAGSDSARVVFTGRLPHDQALACIRDAHVLVLVSQIEALPITVLEAMSLGVPVICANCGPSLEIIEDGVNGVLISPDSKEELTQAILALLSSPADRSEIATQGLITTNSRFSLENCVYQSLTFYKSLRTNQFGVVKNG